MRYYVIYEKKKYYFPYNAEGLREAQEFIKNHKIVNATIFITEGYRGE